MFYLKRFVYNSIDDRCGFPAALADGTNRLVFTNRNWGVKIIRPAHSETCTSETAGTGTNDVGRADTIDDGIFSHIPDGSTIPDSEWRGRHKLFIIAVLSHIPILSGLGLAEGSESITGMTLPTIPTGMLALEMCITAAFAFVAAVPRLNRRLRTSLAVTGLAESRPRVTAHESTATRTPYRLHHLCSG